MDKQTAVQVLIQYGLSNFYDEIPDISADDIFLRIRRYILDSQPKGLPLWERDIISISVALEGCTDAELDYILEQNYAIYHDKVGGGRKFFRRLQNMMKEALKERKSQFEL
jgi:hypothetical protein